MHSLTLKAFARYHDYRLRRLHEDQQGLSLVAYSLGAAFIVVPLGVALYLFGQNAAGEADQGLQDIITASGG